MLIWALASYEYIATVSSTSFTTLVLEGNAAKYAQFTKTIEIPNPLNHTDFYMFSNWHSALSSKVKIRVFYGRDGKCSNSFLAALMFNMSH